MKNLLLSLVVLVLLSACQSGSKQYTISGVLKGADEGKIYLVKAEQGKAVVIDTTELKDQAFEITGSVETPEIYYLRLNEREYFAQFFLENANITVTANKDSLRNTVIEGSELNDIFNVYLSEIEKLNKESVKLRENYNKAMSTGNMDEADKAKIDYEAMMANMDVFARNYIYQNKNTVVAPFIYLSQFINNANAEELDTIANLFPEELAESIYVKEIKRIAGMKKKTATGGVAPDFTQNDPEGNPISLSSLKGQYVLIDFWASWCGPCRRENPNVVKLYKKFHDKGFEILGVSLDQSKEDWLKAIKDDKLEWLHVSDLKYWKNEVAQLYGVQSIPHTVLLDKDGKIIAEKLRGKALEDKLTELLGN